MRPLQSRSSPTALRRRPSIRTLRSLTRICTASSSPDQRGSCGSIRRGRLLRRLRAHRQRQVLVAITIDRQSPDGFAVAGGDLCEAELLVVVPDQAVTRGRNIAPHDLGDLPLPRPFDQILQDRFLDAAAENATGHDPAVDVPALTGLTADD